MCELCGLARCKRFTVLRSFASSSAYKCLVVLMDVGAVAQATVAVASIFMRVVEVDASTGSPHERRRKIREENSRDLLPALMGIPVPRNCTPRRARRRPPTRGIQHDAWGALN